MPNDNTQFMGYDFEDEINVNLFEEEIKTSREWLKRKKHSKNCKPLFKDLTITIFGCELTFALKSPDRQGISIKTLKKDHHNFELDEDGNEVRKFQ